MKNLEKLIYNLESKIEFAQKINAEVSKSNVAWQIDHSLKVINGIIYTLKNSNPEDYKWTFNLKRLVIFTTNKIPRGKGKAPKSVQSYEPVSEQQLFEQIEISKKLLQDLKNLDKKNNFKHPYFNVLNLKQSIKFLNIHTNHHIKIIDDILMK